MKTALEHFKSLPADEYEKAIRSYDKNMQLEYENLSAALIDTIVWHSTPEGEQYWHDIYDRELHKGAYISHINQLVKAPNVDANKISDGYHTFGELYEHRIVLFIALCRTLDGTLPYEIWRSENHSDGTTMDGWFVLGINKDAGKQMTYHLPMSKWEDTAFASTLSKAPEFDNHTSGDVLERLSNLLK